MVSTSKTATARPSRDFEKALVCDGHSHAEIGSSCRHVVRRIEPQEKDDDGPEEAIGDAETEYSPEQRGAIELVGNCGPTSGTENRIAVSNPLWLESWAWLCKRAVPFHFAVPFLLREFFMPNRPSTLWRLLKRTTVNYFAHDMATYAAALAYRLLFSLFPFLIFLTTLLGFIGMPRFFGWMREQAAYMLPEQAMEAVDGVLAELQTPQGGLMSVAIALAIWAASAGVMGTMNALNVAFGVKERRPAWKRLVVAVAYTLALALMLIIAAALMVSGPAFLTWLTQHIGLDALFIAVWTWVRWPLAVFLLMLVVALVYYAAPNLKQPFRLVTSGSVLAVAIWVAASFGFGFYVQNFASYNQIYGSMSAVIVLLFYFFLSAAVLLFGAELNATIAQESSNSDTPG